MRVIFHKIVKHMKFDHQGRSFICVHSSEFHIVLRQINRSQEYQPHGLGVSATILHYYVRSTLLPHHTNKWYLILVERLSLTQAGHIKWHKHEPHASRTVPWVNATRVEAIHAVEAIEKLAVLICHRAANIIIISWYPLHACQPFLVTMDIHSKTRRTAWQPKSIRSSNKIKLHILL